MAKKTNSKSKQTVSTPVVEAPAPAPAPVPVPQEVQTTEETPIETLFKDVLTDLTEQKNLVSNAINNVKQLQKTYLKEQKSNKKKKKTRDPSKKREPSGFAKPTKISKELCDFLSKPNGTEMARTEVTKYLTEYIKNNNLQWEQDKRKIVPDKKLSKLLDCKKDDDVTYFNLQKWMKPHFSKAVSTPAVVV